MIESLTSIQQLPPVHQLRRNAQAIALLDAALITDWQYRYFSFNSRWDVGEAMASMRDGAGSAYFILFNDAGAVGTCRCGPPMAALEAELDRLPAAFDSFRNEPAFSVADSTYLFWRLTSHADHQQDTWHAGPPDCDDYPLLGMLLGDPLAYQRYAEAYAEVEIPLAPIERVFDTLTLDSDVLARINPGLSPDDVADDIAEIIG